jgi:beta-xylosidase
LRIFNFLLNKSSILIGFRIQNKHFQSAPYKLGKFKKTTQLADPFLFTNNQKLYCFFEEYRNLSKGSIKVLTTSDLRQWEKQSVSLNVDCHLSFPFVFKDDNMQIYMIPESGALNEVAIYKPKNFPINWEKYSVLLEGNFVDSHIYKAVGVYYLFTTKKVKNNTVGLSFDYQLELYFSDKIDGKYVQHPFSPIAIGRKFGRSAGSVFFSNGQVIRPVQDCLDKYGDDIHLFEILKISKTEYKEKLIEENHIRNRWKEKEGGHHISFVNFKGEAIWAYDYNFKESYFQRFINKLKI